MAHVLAQDLRNAVLQAAVQGKLTEQLPKDGNAQNLLVQVKEEKEKLIASKIIKKDTVCDPITDIPFTIPNNWEWVRLGTISTYAQPKEKINASNANPEQWLLDLEDIKKGGQLLNKVLVKNKKAVGDKTVFRANNILYSKLRPYLLKVLIADEDGICTPELIPFSMYGNISNDYMVYYLKSPYVDAEINRVTYGVKMPRVGTETMINLLVPLPPLAEQHRIVARIEELMAKIDKYEQAENELAKLKTEFPENMKDSILQAAMEGKLTEQLESDKRINLDNLYQNKKKDNIVDFIKPYTIPDSWQYVNILDICQMKQWKTVGKNQLLDSGYPVYGANGIIGYYSEYNHDKPTLLITCRGATCGCTNITEGQCYVNGNALACDNLLDYVNIHFFKYYIDSLNMYNLKIITGTAQPQITQDSIAQLLVPIPPMEEQIRIVEKLDKLLPICDKFKKLA